MSESTSSYADKFSRGCIAGWPMAPCGVLTATPPLCAMHRVAADRVWESLTDDQREALSSLPTSFFPQEGVSGG